MATRGADKANGEALVEQISRRKQGRVHEQAAEKPGKKRCGDIARVLSATRIHGTAPPGGRRADLIVEGLKHGAVCRRRK
jgi:hypothetical protein